MIKNYPILKKIVPFVFLFFSFSAFSQTAGDFRSITNGNWTSLTSWQYFNGSSWATPSGTNPQGYPGQFAGTGTVTIQNSNNITINTNITNSFTALVIGGGVSGILTVGADINVSTLSTIINAGGLMKFSGQNDITFPTGASIQIISPGKIDDGGTCTNNVAVYIGTVKYAVCTGSGNADFTFDQLNSGGGSLKSNPSYNSPVCGNTISLIGDYTGVINTTKPVGYKWTASGPSTVTFNPDTNASSPIATINPSTYPSVYTFTLTVTNDGNSNSKTISVTVNAIPTTPIVSLTQPTCAVETGTITVTAPTGTGMTYSINGSTYTNTTGIFTTVAAATYSVTAKSAAGCISSPTSVTINVQPSLNTWNGFSDNNWNNAANWSCGGVPTISTDVLIPTIPTGGKFPILTAYSASTYHQGYVKNIIFDSGTTLIIENNALNVVGNLTLNGNSKIDLEGESQLIQSTGSTFSGSGTIEIDQQGEGNKYRYNYWSMPVYTDTDGIMGKHTTIFATLRDGTNPSSPAPITFNNSGYDGATSPFTLSTYWMYKYANSGGGYSAWDQVRSTGKVYAGQGFTMKGPGAPGSPAQNYVFVGKPNNGIIELTVAKNNDYLVGNPYPSALDAYQFLDDNSPTGTASITGTIYFWEHYGGNTHNLAGYQAGYATLTKSGGVQASAFPGLGGGISAKGAPKRDIPVGQAFFVVGEAVDGGQIQFNNGQRVFVKEGATSIFMKSSNTKSKTENTRGADLRPKFRIGFDAPKISHRQLLLTIDERATPAVDWGYDAEIYEVFVDDMYWMLNNKKYVIQATNEVGLNSEVPLGIQLSKTGMVTVKIDALENVDDDISVYLKDKLTGETFNMRDKPVQLNLTAGKYADRFVLVFKTQKLVAEDVVAEVLIPAAAQPIIEGMHVFMNNAIGELQIKNNSTEEIVSVALVNTLGQTIKTWNSNFNIRTISLPLSTATGIYFVQISTKIGKTVKKISVE